MSDLCSVENTAPANEKKNEQGILETMNADVREPTKQSCSDAEGVRNDGELQELYGQAFVLADRDASVAKTLADQLYARASEEKNAYWQSLSRYIAGFCFYNLSEYDHAMEEFERGDRIAQENDLPALTVKFRNGYGAIFSRLGQYHHAVEQYADGLRKAREMGLTSDTGHFLVNLGEVCLLMGDVAQALSFELEAEKLVGEMPGDSGYAVDVYYNLAEAQSRNGQIENAERSYRRSLEIATSVGNTLSEVEARVRLGTILADHGHEVEGLEIIEGALQLSRECSFPLQGVASLLACGRIEMKLGQLEKAARHFEVAVEVADGHHMGDLLPSALELLSAAKVAMDCYKEAYDDLQKSVEAARAWSGAEASRMLVELATGYRLEKAKREAEIEKVRRQELESANERLRTVTRIGRSLTQSLEPKDILLRMWNELSGTIDLAWLGVGICSPGSGVIEFPGWIYKGILQEASSVFLNDEASLAALCVREKRVLFFPTAVEAQSMLGGNPLITFAPNQAAPETILYLPLFRENDIVGVLTVQSTQPHVYTDDTVEMLKAVASFAAIAVENAQIMIRLDELNRAISGEKEQVEKVALASSWLAEHDSLTGLFNRRFLEKILDESIRLATLENSGIAVFFVDLDDFKRVNDTYGHDAGDRVLVAAAARLASVFREGDYVARVGGDEFVVVAPTMKSRDTIAAVADRVVSSFHEPFVIREAKVTLSISVGIAVFPEHGRSSRELIDCSDHAMYAVKRNEKGAWHLAGSS